MAGLTRCTHCCRCARSAGHASEAVAALGLLLGLAVLAVVGVRHSLPSYVLGLTAKRGPPEQGGKITLVLTDVEGSTELWEWNNKVCARCQMGLAMLPAALRALAMVWWQVRLVLADLLSSVSDSRRQVGSG